jgi:hypothetical protein
MHISDVTMKKYVTTKNFFLSNTSEYYGDFSLIVYDNKIEQYMLKSIYRMIYQSLEPSALGLNIMGTLGLICHAIWVLECIILYSFNL